MRTDLLNKAAQIADRVGHVLVASAADDCTPHVATAGQMRLLPDSVVRVTAWFCPATVSNIQDNPRVSLVVWDTQTDEGYQLVGRAEGMADLSIMDGYIPGERMTAPLPQVQRQIDVRVEEILHFTRGPHSDMDESAEPAAARVAFDFDR